MHVLEMIQYRNDGHYRHSDSINNKRMNMVKSGNKDTVTMVKIEIFYIIFWSVIFAARN